MLLGRCRSIGSETPSAEACLKRSNRKKWSVEMLLSKYIMEHTLADLPPAQIAGPGSLGMTTMLSMSELVTNERWNLQDERRQWRRQLNTIAPAPHVSESGGYVLTLCIY